MNYNNKHARVLLFVSMLSCAVAFPTVAYAQGTTVIPNVDTDTGLKVVAVGTLAGIIVAYQGYRATKKDWDTLRFLDGVLQSVLGSIPFAIGYAVTQPAMGIFEYVSAFFAAMGTGYMIKQTRKRTIPSNHVGTETAPEIRADTMNVADDDDDDDDQEELPPGKDTVV